MGHIENQLQIEKQYKTYSEKSVKLTEDNTFEQTHAEDSRLSDIENKQRRGSSIVSTGTLE